MIKVFASLAVMLSAFTAQALDLRCECTGCTPVEMSLQNDQWMKVLTRNGDSETTGYAVRTSQNKGDQVYYKLGVFTFKLEANQWTIMGTDYVCEEKVVN
ncbi:MAG: hypothetical protein KDD33_11220 [Bdellovibrionales bacterium]|nr:hypothetical protein [Bdellovibrionales bacterium]